jgi:CHAD domain-containing protein
VSGSVILEKKSALTADSALWAWAREAITERAEWMLEHLEGVRKGEDIEAVHDMRVGSRRLVAAMRVFHPCFPGPAYERVFREARRVTRRLGEVRDLDVLIDHYEKLGDEAAVEDAPGVDYFIAVKQRERCRVRRPMLRAMSKVEDSDLIGRIERLLTEESDMYSVGLMPPAPRGGVDPTDSFRNAAPLVLEERYHALYAFEPYVDHPEEAEQLHAMRIAAKWLRYTMELFAPAYKDGLKQPLAAVKRIQELLGDLHDSDVRLDILQDMSERPLDAAGLEALGTLRPEPVKEALRRLRVQEVDVRQGCYRAFRKEWKKLERKKFGKTCLERIRNPNARAG